MSYRTVTALEWRCCPGFTGSNCEEGESLRRDLAGRDGAWDGDNWNEAGAWGWDQLEHRAGPHLQSQSECKNGKGAGSGARPVMVKGSGQESMVGG